MPKMLFTVTEDWAFCSHRLPTAFAARDAGFDVVVAARMHDHREQIERLGFRAVAWNIQRESLNPVSEFAAVRDLIRIYREERPDATYHVAIKAIMYGSIAARITGVKRTFNLFSGLGVVFISKTLKFKFIRATVTPVLRWALKPANTHLHVQNRDDRETLIAHGISTPERTDLIPGSGIDTDEYPQAPAPDASPVTAVVVSRMLWDKGIGEVAEAARLLQARGVKLKIILVGAPDPANPSTIPQAQLESWAAEGVVEWWGRRNNIAEIFANCDIAVLPSYREGMPRSLLEAASTGRPMVAFDAVGCRDLVRDGHNGFLVPFQDAEALADALETLTKDRDLRLRFGQQARMDVETTFSADAIRKRMTDIFKHIPHD